jgi:hypothetical protein
VERIRTLYADSGSREKLGTNVVMFGSSSNTCPCSCSKRSH